MIDFDEDGNEVIDFTEFTKMMKVHKERSQKEPDSELRNAFRFNHYRYYYRYHYRYHISLSYRYYRYHYFFV